MDDIDVALTKSLAGTLVDVASALDDLVRYTVGMTSQRPGSPADIALRDPINGSPSWRGWGPVRRVHEDVLVSTLAGIDHGRALATLIRSPRPPSVALATIARGALEAYGRGFAMIQDRSAKGMLTAQAQSAFEDLTDTINAPNGDLRQATSGAVVSATQMRDRVKAYSKTIGAPLGDRLGPANRVWAMMRAAAPTGAITDDDARLVYSSLSSVAHGQSFSLNRFLAFDPKKVGSGEAV